MENTGLSIQFELNESIVPISELLFRHHFNWFSQSVMNVTQIFNLLIKVDIAEYLRWDFIMWPFIFRWSLIVVQCWMLLAGKFFFSDAIGVTKKCKYVWVLFAFWLARSKFLDSWDMLRRNVTLYIVQRINLNRLDGILQTFDCFFHSSYHSSSISLFLLHSLSLHSSPFPSSVFIHHTVYNGDGNILFSHPKRIVAAQPHNKLTRIIWTCNMKPSKNMLRKIWALLKRLRMPKVLHSLLVFLQLFAAMQCICVCVVPSEWNEIDEFVHTANEQHVQIQCICAI